MAFFTIKELQGVDDEDLEYIPDRPDFIDGDYVADDYPTNEIHTGELPSEQDPRDKVEIGDNDDYEDECESFEIILESPESGDMTDLIENNLLASRREALWGKKQQPWQQIQDPATGKSMYGNEAEAALGYNVFDDPNVQKYLQDHGLHKEEIDNFANLRQHQLDQAKQAAYLGQPTSQYGVQKTPGYKWGQDTGVKIKNAPQTKSSGKPTGIRIRHHDNVKTPEARKYVQTVLIPALQRGKTIPGVNPQIVAWYSRQLTKHPNAPSAKYDQPSFQPINWAPAASRSLGKLKSYVNVVGGFLAMPRTADVIRQAADMVSAVHEIDDGKTLDETTRSALRNTSCNLLTATNHLKSVNNRLANKVAGEIEQLFVDSLSN